MIIKKELSNISLLSHPFGLTIGSFDGVHQGHKYLIDTLRKEVTKQGTVAVLTFSNHPTSILRPSPIPLISTVEQKLSFLKKCGVDVVFLLTFTPELASLSYEDFLKRVRDIYPFNYLVLGEGATFGKSRLGNKDNVTNLAQSWGFSVKYCEKFTLNGHIVSSGRIRELIREGDLSELEILLNRPYSSVGILEGDKIYFRQEMPFCLLPEGTYQVVINAINSPLLATIKCTGSLSHAHVCLHLDRTLEWPPGTSVEIFFKTR